MEILLVLTAFACLYFFITSYMLYKQNQVLKIAVLEEVAKRNILTDKDSQTAQENFLKFVSDSREWAYEYIDNVQTELKRFIDIADKEFAYFDQYGILSQGYPHYETMKIMSEEYKKLKQLLPEENNA